jgi:hypothetical protein
VFERDVEIKRVLFSQPKINAACQEQILPIVLGFWKARALAVATRMSVHIVDRIETMPSI